MDTLTESFRRMAEQRMLSPCEDLWLNGGRFWECPCWAVSEELPAAASLPAYIGIHAMAASCENWARTRYIGGTGPHRIRIAPGQIAVVDYIRGENPVTANIEFQAGWPVPIERASRQVWMAVRQRIELTESEQRQKLAAVVHRHPRWPDVLSRIANAAAPYPSLKMAFCTQGRVTSEERSGQEIWIIVQAALASAGFSHSPGLIAYAAEQGLPNSPYLPALRQIAAGGPAPGLLVESLFILDPTLRPQQGEVLSNISGSSFEAGMDFWDAASRKVAEHQSWWTARVSVLTSALRPESTGRPCAPDTLNVLIDKHLRGEITTEELYADDLETQRLLWKAEGCVGSSPNLNARRGVVQKRLKRATEKKSKKSRKIVRRNVPRKDTARL